MLGVEWELLSEGCCVLKGHWVLDGHVGESGRNGAGSCESRRVNRYGKALARVRGAVLKVKLCGLKAQRPP